MKTIILFLIFSHQAFAIDTCSRVAVIDGQEVLVDTSTAEKGEGLRFYLEKDPVAKNFLNKYQANNQMKWQSAAIGTAGTLLILAGILTGSSSKKRTTYLISGSSLMAVNFFFSKTIENSNEKNLKRSIEEYNKRNSPSIFLKNNEDKKHSFPFALHKTWSF